jgi:hypothetical protein
LECLFLLLDLAADVDLWSASVVDSIHSQQAGMPQPCMNRKAVRLSVKLVIVTKDKK